MKPGSKFSVLLLLLLSTVVLAGYRYTVDEHPLCNGSKINGECPPSLDAVACSYEDKDVEGEHRTFYSTCILDAEDRVYRWIHTSYLPWSSDM